MDGLLLIAAAGLVAGYVNAIAGAGSLLTLPALVFSGLDASAANATNRISVLAHAVTSGWTFRSKGVNAPPALLWLTAPACLGAGLGAWVASVLEPDAIGLAIALVMVVMVVLQFVRPRTDVLPASDARVGPAMVVGFFAIGVYAGFIQAGTGILVLLFLASFRVDLVSGNAVKVIVNAALTVIAIAVFAFQRETIDLARGFLLAATTSVGGVIGARAAVKRGEGFIKLAVTIAVLASAAKLLYDTF